MPVFFVCRVGLEASRRTRSTFFGVPFFLAAQRRPFLLVIHFWSWPQTSNRLCIFLGATELVQDKLRPRLVVFFFLGGALFEGVPHKRLPCHFSPGRQSATITEVLVTRLLASAEKTAKKLGSEALGSKQCKSGCLCFSGNPLSVGS